MTNTLELRDVSVAIEERPIINSLSFSLEKGEIACLLGPSGCGKTTLLRTIAGFERPTTGEVWLESRLVSDEHIMVPVEDRKVGMVFQDYALFPHLNVKDNIAFGLQQMNSNERKARVEEMAELLEVSSFLNDYPHRLSGGQQQRVALARAIATRPNVLLLDEPFASLDIELREQIAKEMRTVLKANGVTAILVSHNQMEAFAMADTIGVMRDGALLQWDNAFTLYHRPVCTYVADFVGDGVFLPGKVINSTNVETELGIINGGQSHGFAFDDEVIVLIRPDDIIHDDSSGMQAKVQDKAFRGAEFLYTLALESGLQVLTLVPSHHNHALDESIGIRLEIDHLVVFPAQ
ncbi:MAG: ABC transporter ATP-binding protein [Gammaproteobacteria bacterium]|jgi:iron(III) transport system ATP-binding protein|nr:ABC transporter ATP-binding protein [Gammaproteobacteria bacterium]